MSNEGVQVIRYLRSLLDEPHELVGDNQELRELMEQGRWDAAIELLVSIRDEGSSAENVSARRQMHMTESDMAEQILTRITHIYERAVLENIVVNVLRDLS